MTRTWRKEQVSASLTSADINDVATRHRIEFDRRRYYADGIRTVIRDAVFDAVESTTEGWRSPPGFVALRQAPVEGTMRQR